MDDRFDILIDVLEKSIVKNGDIPLTTGHLLNIMKYVNNLCDAYESEDTRDDWMWGGS